MAANDIGPRIGIDGEAQFKASIAAINAQYKALSAEMKAVTAEFAANATSEDALAAKNQVLGSMADTARQKMSMLEKQIASQKEKLAGLGQTLDENIRLYGENSSQAAQAQNAYNRQAAAVANLEQKYQTARKQVAELNNAMADVGDSADQAAQSLGAGDILAANAAWDGIKTTVDAVSSALKDCISTTMEFDSSMSDVAATMGTTVDQLGGLREFALEMGANTAFTASEAAQALNYMALAGYDAQEAMEALPNVLNLAAAGGIDLAAASDMVTDAQSALGLSMEESARLVDEMAKASTKTNTSVAQLGEAILTVGGTAKYMAGGTQEINQVLGVLADNSIKGAEGGTKLRNILLSLTSPTDAAANRLDALGVSVFDAEGKLREFSDIFPELQAALSTLTDEQQLQALDEIFNSRDIAAAQALLGTTVERWNELEVAIDGAAGAAQQMADTKLDNLAGDLTLLQSATDNAKIALTDSLTPALREVVQAGTGIMGFVSDFLEEVPLASSVVAGLTVSLGSLTIGMGATAAASALTGGAVTTLTGALGALSTAILASPLAPWAIGLGVVVTAVTALSSATTDTAIRVEDLTNSMDDLISKESRSEEEKVRLISVVDQLNAAIPGLELEYNALTDTLNMTADEVRAAAAAHVEEIRAAEDTADALEEEGDAAEETGEKIKELSVSVEELEEATLYAAGAADTMSEALSEQEKQGSLSLQTAKSLIEAGYEAAISIDEETGAVTLNREAYVKLAETKIQEQLATLEAERARKEYARGLAEEEAAATDDANAFWKLAQSKAAATYADDVQALDLQIAALKRAQASLTSYSGATSTAARASSSASKKIKTQAEKDLEDYKSLKAELDHEKTMGLVEEAEYYQKMAQLRDSYLADESNLSEYRKVNEQIYKYDQSLLEDRQKLWEEASQNILDLEANYQEELASRAKEISSSYKLFEEVPERQKVAGTELMANLEEQIASIQDFYSSLDALAGRGVSEQLVEEIRGMGVSASGELSGLLELTDEQLTKYAQLYEEKQSLANEIAMKELEGLREDTNEEILSQMDEIQLLYDQNAPDLGYSFAANIADGIWAGMPLVEEAAQAVAAAAMSAAGMNRDVEALMPASGQRVTGQEIGDMLAGAVNALNAGGNGGVAQPANITIQTRDGIEIARAFLPDIRTASKERPETLDDY